MLCDGRMVCGCADPYGKRVLGDARTASVRGRLDGTVISQLRDDLNAGGSKFCGDCPLKLPLKTRRDSRRRGRSTPARCPRGCTSSARRPATSPAPRRAARPKPASRARARRACSTSICSVASSTRSGPSLGAHRLLQLRRGVPAQARRRDVRVHQDAVSAHLSVHEHQRPGAHRSAGPAAGALGHRRGDVLDRRRHPGKLRAIPAARTSSTSRSRNAARRWPTKSGASGRDVPFLNWRYILFKWNDSDEEMNARAPAGRRDRRRSAVLGDHRPSRGQLLAALRARARRSSRRSSHEIWDNSGPGQRDSRRDAARADRRADARAAALPLRAAPAGRCACARACATCRIAPFPRRRPTAGGSSGSARSCATRTARSSNRDFARAWLPETLGARRAGRRRHRDPGRPSSPGRYALKFDLVSEGIDWFERCGLGDHDAKTLWVGSPMLPPPVRLRRPRRMADGEVGRRAPVRRHRLRRRGCCHLHASADARVR